MEYDKATQNLLKWTSEAWEKYESLAAGCGACADRCIQSLLHKRGIFEGDDVLVDFATGTRRGVFERVRSDAWNWKGEVHARIFIRLYTKRGKLFKENNCYGEWAIDAMSPIPAKGEGSVRDEAL